MDAARYNKKVLSFNYGEVRGYNNEDRVEQALELLRGEGQIYDHYRADRRGELDERGVDFQIYVSPYRLMNLQVKSSHVAKMEHKLKEGDLIPCIITRESIPIEQIMRIIMEEINRTNGEELRVALIRARNGAHPEPKKAVSVTGGDRFEDALNILSERGHIYGFTRAKPGGELLRRGVHFQIDVSRYRLMNLRVEASDTEHYETKHGVIAPHVTADASTPMRGLVALIRREVERTILEELTMAYVKKRTKGFSGMFDDEVERILYEELNTAFRRHSWSYT